MNVAALKIGSLFSFCGGPLFICDLLKPRIGTLPAFLITFLPVGLMVVAALFMDDVHSRWLFPLVRAGRLGVFVVLGMHVYAIACFAGGVRVPDQVLHYIGIAIGLVWTAYFLRASRRWARRIEAAHAPDPSSPKPIE